MRYLLILISFFISIHLSAQTINWQSQGNFEMQRSRSLQQMGIPVRDSVGGVGFSNRDSIGSIIFHPNGGFYILDRYGWQRYYNGIESDNRYVLSPSGKITANWIQAWNYAIGAEMPNVTNPDLKYLIVNGNAGDTILNVIGGTGTVDFTPLFAGVAFDKAGDHYFSFLVTRQSGSVYNIDRPLKYNLVADTIKFMWSSYQGQHMTDYGYRGYADNIYDYQKNLAAKDYKLYSFYPEDNPTTIPFTAIGGAVQGGLIPGTSSPQLIQITTATINYSQRATMHYRVQQGTAADRGVEWTTNLGKKNGYLETWVGTNLDLPGFTKVLFYLDGVLKKTDTVRGAIQKLTYNFSGASTGKLQIVTGDAQPTDIRIGTTVWYQTDISTTGKVYTGGKIMFVGDSWTQHYLNGGVFFQSSPVRFRARWVANGGNPNDIINVGRGGMTSAWGKYWFKYWINLYKPKYIYIEFYINDSNSSSFVGDNTNTTWNFSSTDPYSAGVDVDGKVTQQNWIDNLKWMRDTAIAYGATPILLMNTPTGSLTQTQGQSAWFSALRPASQYYDIETLFASGVYADNSVNAPTVNATYGNIDTINNKVTRGGAATTALSGAYLIGLKATNSSITKGMIIYPETNYTGSLGKILSVQNVPTIGSGEVFSIANNGLTTSAVGFSAGVNGYVITPFSITYSSNIARISATNSTTINDLYIGDSLKGVTRMRIPTVMVNYATAALPTSALQRVKGGLAYDSDVNKLAVTDGATWKYVATEDFVNTKSGTYNYAGPTGNYTVLSSDQYITNLDNTAPAPTFTLPAASSAGVGKWYLISNENLNGNLAITLSQSVALLDGTTTATVPPGMSIRIMSDGTAWREIQSSRRSNIYTVTTATDANYTIPDAATIVVLPVITANRTVTLPALQTGQTLTIHNRNSAAFNWSFTNTNVKDAAGNTITNMINQSVYQFYYDGTNLYKTN